ncbi:FAD-dependent oxidoreductase [Nocardiopsis lucentensis]|uniref:FAD-dependent oxidoreductase n=1 Tax=Nocardiopsis lucentensis TaxID=53441 RepID=UPI00034AD72A|nr:FAD-dependent monooxygenase [Nocardiopsis lucentensis]
MAARPPRAAGGGRRGPDEVYESLERAAESKWDAPWRTGVVETIRDRSVIATPISEYLPERVVDGRVALVGDAAHAQTPMTGAGFEEAVIDAAALARELGGADDLGAALQRYELLRIGDMRDRMAAGASFSRGFAGV